MKKLIALILICLLSFGTVASAESINVDNLTHDELLSLHNQISLKLFSAALVDGIELPYGEYEGGVDIPAGSYVITVCGEKISCEIQVFEGTQREEYLFRDHNRSTENVPYSVKVTVKEGQYLKVGVIYQNGTITIKPWSVFFAN